VLFRSSHLTGMKNNGRRPHPPMSAEFFDYALPVLYVKHFFKTGALKNLHFCNHTSRIYDNIVFFNIVSKTVCFLTICNSYLYTFLLNGTQVA
jgi:hypothetical protein